MTAKQLSRGDNGRWFGRDILSVSQFSREDLEACFGVAEVMRTLVANVGAIDALHGKVLANLFYEPSTRTQSSFTAAMQRLGGHVIPISEVRYSSVSKGESLPDTVRTLECYADVIVLRHPEMGSARIAADAARKPIINAGDGVGEHPTQALLDLFTIREERGTLEGLTLTLLGDLKFGRTVHSLARLSAFYGMKLELVSPEQLRMPPAILDELRAMKVSFREHTDLEAVLSKTDVLYVTRVQKERFEDLEAYERLRASYIIDRKTLERAPKQLVLMHPLPRVGEISPEVDADPRAAYFRQMEYGLYIRMALLAMILGKF